MNRNTILWTLVAFFGASLVFGLLRRLTEDASPGAAIAVQFGALAAVIAAVVLIARRFR